MPRSAFTKIDASDMDTLATRAGVPLPLEQSGHWDRFDESVSGRRPWGRLLWTVNDEPVAVISLTHFVGRGFTYLWAKHGPIWLRHPSTEEQRQFRAGLVNIVRYEDPGVTFIRLHANDAGADLRELLQSVTYDRTIILDLTPDDDERMALMKKRGRRDVRKALRDDSLVAADESDRALEVFGELYELLIETGERDEFGILPRSTYESMLRSLGSDHCKLFTVRRDGRPLCWGIVTVNGNHASYYYAASNDEGREAGAPDLLVWSMMQFLRGAGVEVFDLMGIDSERAPQLAGVRMFKTKFTEDIDDIAGAWDVPVHRRRYDLLVTALKVKRAATAKLKK